MCVEYSMTRAFRMLLGTVMVTLACQFISGCVLLAFPVYGVYNLHTPRRNVTGQPEHWGGYVPGAVYRLKHDVFIADLAHYSYGPGLATGKEFPLFGPGEWGGPTTAAEYRANPADWPEMEGIVEAGTLLRCESICHWRYLGEDLHSYLMKTRIMTGPLEGRVVEIHELSLQDCDTAKLSPHPEILERVQSPPRLSHGASRWA